MIETFKDRTTGEIFQNQTVLCEFYVFWREDMLREQDKAPNVVCVLTGDWSGIRLADDKQRIRIEPIRFILPEGNEGRTLEDYLAAEVELPDNISDPHFQYISVMPDKVRILFSHVAFLHEQATKLQQSCHRFSHLHMIITNSVLLSRAAALISPPCRLTYSCASAMPSPVCPLSPL